MGIFLKLSALAARPLLRLVAGEAGETVADAIGCLRKRFTDQSAKLSNALQEANERAWKALEFALAGDSLLNVLARPEEKAFRAQVQSLLTSAHFNLPADGEQNFRSSCLHELRSARATGLLDNTGLDPDSLAREMGHFTRFAAPGDELAAEWQVLEQIADQLPARRYPNLVRLLKFRPQNGPPVLTAAARYFFRQAVVTDPELLGEHLVSELKKVRETQDLHFEQFWVLLRGQGRQLEEGFAGVAAVGKRVEELADRVSDLTDLLERLLNSYQLGQRPLSPRDSFSYRDEAEREHIRDVVRQCHALPRRAPAAAGPGPWDQPAVVPHRGTRRRRAGFPSGGGVAHRPACQGRGLPQCVPGRP
jgi:hypothetical protein